MRVLIPITVWIFVASSAYDVGAQEQNPAQGPTSEQREETLRTRWSGLLKREAEIAATERRLREAPPEGSVAAVVRKLKEVSDEARALEARIGELAARQDRQLRDRLEPVLRTWTGSAAAAEKAPRAGPEPPTAPDSERRPAEPQPASVADTASTAVPCGDEGSMALPVPERTGLYRRVLATPGARLRERPDPGDPGKPVPLFSILYVSAESGDWLCAGPALDDAGRGWIRYVETRPWKHMLVARFVEKGVRRRVLFFSDEERLRTLLEDPDGRALAEKLYEELNTKGMPGGVVAVEPEAAIDDSKAPYLLPIVEATDAETDEGQIVRMVRVAAATRPFGNTETAERSAAAKAAATEGAGDVRAFSVGIVFVVDTTSSMGPYINEIRRFLAYFQALARKSRYGDRVKFAVVGYRDNTSPDPRIGYVARVFFDFEAALSDRVLDRALAVEPAKVSTRDWREDAVAGLRAALEELSWEDVDARVLVLVTDASARDAGDPFATTRYGIESIRALAQQRDVGIIVIHMRTPEAEQAGDVRRAERQYRQLATTGDRNVRKYIGLEGNTIEAFHAQLQRTAEELMAALERVGALAQRAPAEHGETQSASQPSLSGLLLHEIFARSWLQAIGRATGASLPEFVEGWAADRDLVRPDYETLAVSVLLTRTELDDLAERLSRIVEAVRAGGTAEEFWQRVWRLSGEKVTDPQAIRRIGQLLPSFLDDLPYRSKILSLTKDDWDIMKQTEKLGLINEIAEKVAIYTSASENQAAWIRMDEAERSKDLYALELRYLP
jgi:serine/threonine-protein kinase PpkA